MSRMTMKTGIAPRIALTMGSSEDLTFGRFLDRQRKFLVTAKVNDKIKTAFLSHTGRLPSLLHPGASLLLRKRSSREKSRLSLEVLAVRQRGTWVCIKSQLANQLVERAVLSGALNDLPSDLVFRREPKLPGGGRADFALEASDTMRILIEVKSCCEKDGDDVIFPDTVTERGTRQVHALGRIARNGIDVRVCFVAMRSDAAGIRLAKEIDRSFVEAIELAQKQGVKLLGLRVKVTARRISLLGPIPVVF